jgi:hypothetical protein
MHRAAKHRRKAKFVPQPREESCARPFMIITLGTIRSMRPTLLPENEIGHFE